MRRTILKLAIIASIGLALSGCASNVDNQQMTLKFAFGERTGTYSGQVENNLPNGKGKFTTKNEQGITWTHEGEFKNGHFEGKGKQTFADGQTEEGIFHDDYLNGEGKIHLKGNVIQEGTFVNGKLNGKGKVSQNNQVIYEGVFKNGIPDLPAVKFNEAQSFADWNYEATGVEYQTTIGNKAPSGVFLIVHMHVQNNGNSSRQFANYENPYIVLDNQGRKYKYDDKAMLSAKNHRLFDKGWYLSEINPGLSEDLPLIFDIPKDAKGLQLLPANGIGKAHPIDLGDAG